MELGFLRELKKLILPATNSPGKFQRLCCTTVQGFESSDCPTIFMMVQFLKALEIFPSSKCKTLVSIGSLALVTMLLISLLL
ncbi:hypothetical protein EV1_042718 [Malus domestica]